MVLGNATLRIFWPDDDAGNIEFKVSKADCKEIRLYQFKTGKG
jgi:hypothetical protein